MAYQRCIFRCLCSGQHSAVVRNILQLTLFGLPCPAGNKQGIAWARVSGRKPIQNCPIYLTVPLFLFVFFLIICFHGVWIRYIKLNWLAMEIFCLLQSISLWYAIHSIFHSIPVFMLFSPWWYRLDYSIHYESHCSVQRFSQLSYCFLTPGYILGGFSFIDCA